MASVVHHRQTLDIPAGAYWAAGVALAFLVMLLAYFSATSTQHVATVTPLLNEPALPFVPFIPML